MFNTANEKFKMENIISYNELRKEINITPNNLYFSEIKISYDWIIIRGFDIFLNHILLN